jgi:hypothetical protein
MKGKSKVKGQKSKVKSAPGLRIYAPMTLAPATKRATVHNHCTRNTFDFCLLTFDF